MADSRIKLEIQNKIALVTMNRAAASDLILTARPAGIFRPGRRRICADKTEEES